MRGLVGSVFHCLLVVVSTGLQMVVSILFVAAGYIAS
jgi:hypothetical protein